MDKEWITDVINFQNSNGHYAMINNFKNLSYIMNCESGEIFAAKLDNNSDKRLTDDEIGCMGCEYVSSIEFADVEEEEFDEDEDISTIPYCEKHECRCEYMDTESCKENDSCREFFVKFCNS